jgi:hypothetical protein
VSLTSRLSAAEDGLLAILQAQAALPSNPMAGIPLRLADPGSGVQQTHIWIPETAVATQTPTVTDQGGGTIGEREEILTLRVVVFVMQAGDDYVTLRNLGDGLVAEVQKAIFASRTLNGSVQDSWVEQVERSGGLTERGRVMDWTISVHAIAELLP